MTITLKRKILIIDPDAFLAGIYARRFEQGSWKVKVAESLGDARRVLTDFNPDVVLIDIETEPDGIAFLKEIRSDDKIDKAVFVVLTKLGDQQQIKEAMDAGADSYLLKGHFVPMEVLEKIERLVS